MADKLAGIGQYDKVDPAFTSVKPSAETLRIAALNAAPGQTAEQYLASRGGVNAAGYYGDSWSATKNLTDIEYFSTINAAKAMGATGAGIGDAINKASALKRYNAALAAGMDPAKAKAAYDAELAGTAGMLKDYKYSGAVYGTDAAGNTYSGSGTNTSPLTINGTPFTGTMGTSNYVNGVVEDTAKKTAQQEFRASLTSLGLADLADTIDQMIRQDYTVAQIKLELPKQEAYKKRFPGMEALSKAGMAINEATYISMERGMLNVLSAYGLDEKILGTREKLGEVIANQVSVAEYESRVQMAADRVQKNTDVLSSLNEFYGVDTAGAMSYLLDPKLGMDIVKKQVRAAEINAAAEMYRFDMSSATAESFINASGTADLNALKETFGKARLLATTQGRLSAIEGEKYSDLEAVATILGADYDRQLESQRRALRESARFGGQTGVSGASLKTESKI